MHFFHHEDAGRVAVGIDQLNWLRERIDVLVSRSRRLMVDDRSHMHRLAVVQSQSINLDLEEDVEEAVGHASGRKWRHIECARGIVYLLFDGAEGCLARIEANKQY